MFDYLVVGAGFAGSVLAERLAAGSARRCSYATSGRTSAGTRTTTTMRRASLIHKYGPHIFHTNSRDVFQYLSRFTEWRHYQHRVLACVDGQLVPIPINLDTVNQLYGTSFNSFQLEEFFESVAEPRRAGADVRRRDRQQGRPRAVREVLPQLHAEAVGARSVRARRRGDRARPGAHESRRPLFHRYLPGDATARLHPNVRDACSRIQTSRSC